MNLESDFDDEYFIYRKDGSNVWVKITGGPHLDVTVAVAKDNSKKHHTHLQVRDKNGIMLHEFNNGVEY